MYQHQNTFHFSISGFSLRDTWQTLVVPTKYLIFLFLLLIVPALLRALMFPQGVSWEVAGVGALAISWTCMQPDGIV